MLKRAILHFVLIASLPLCIFTAAVAQDKGGDAVRKGPDSVEPAAEKKGAGAESGGTAAEKKGAGGPEKSDEVGNAADAVKKAAASQKQEKKKKENKKKQPAKDEPSAAEDGEDRAPKSGLLLIDLDSIKHNRVPGITVKEDRPEETIVKVPDDKISGKTKDKNSKGGLFGSKTDTVAKVGLLVFILIILILYKTRSKKSKRKVVRTVPKR